MSSTGTTTSRSSGLRCPASTIVTGRSPPRKRAISSSGRCVADSPIRCGSVAVIADSRSSESARCEPRLVPATAWISSMITVSTELSTSRAPEVSIRYSDSGVVIRMSGGLRRIAARWRLRRVAASQRDRHRRIGADAGQRRAQVALDVVVQRRSGET